MTWQYNVFMINPFDASRTRQYIIINFLNTISIIT